MFRRSMLFAAVVFVTCTGGGPGDDGPPDETYSPPDGECIESLSATGAMDEVFSTDEGEIPGYQNLSGDLAFGGALGTRDVSMFWNEPDDYSLDYNADTQHSDADVTVEVTGDVEFWKSIPDGETESRCEDYLMVAVSVIVEAEGETLVLNGTMTRTGSVEAYPLLHATGDAGSFFTIDEPAGVTRDESALWIFFPEEFHDMEELDGVQGLLRERVTLQDSTADEFVFATWEF